MHGVVLRTDQNTRFSPGAEAPVQHVWGDGPFERIASEWFVGDLPGEIRQRNRDEAKAVLLYLVQQHGDYRLPDVDAVLLNLLGGSARD